MVDFFQQHRILLAPMAGVSDEAFRMLCREQGADLTYSEMVSAKGLSYANEKTKRLLELAPGEASLAVQIFGHEAATMASQAAWIEEQMGDSLAYIDINMGCPARKIIRKGDGCALMAEPALAKRIIAATSSAVEHPVTVKFRRGFEFGNETAPAFAAMAEEAGAAAVAVHGRYGEQLYRGRSDRGTIRRVKDAVSIPVIGNGDIACAEDALALRSETGCDAVMVGRAAEGNPWIFSQIKAAFDKHPIPAFPTAVERVDMARRHARMLSRREGKNIVRMRKHAMWYLSGLPGASIARREINACVTLADFEQVFDALLNYRT